METRKMKFLREFSEAISQGKTNCLCDETVSERVFLFHIISEL
jgi:hypothetical protein